MKALVTGGGGFIGSWVVKELLEEDIEPRVLLLEGEDERNLEGLDVERVWGDIRDPSSVEKSMNGCQWVFHLAAIYALWLPRPELMREVNVDGTRNVLRAALDKGVERLVYTSTIAVFGGQGLNTDATEKSPFVLGPTQDLYAISKYEAHKIALSFVDKGLDLTIVAPCGPIGPGDVGPTPTGRFLLSSVNLPLCPIVGTIANFGDVRDMARGHVLAARKGRAGESYLLGKENLWYHELASMVHEIAGIRKPKVHIPSPVLKIGAHAMKLIADAGIKRPPLITPTSVDIGSRGLRADCFKAVKELGTPQTPMKKAVKDALTWFAKNGYIKDGRVRRKLMKQSQH